MHIIWSKFVLQFTQRLEFILVLLICFSRSHGVFRLIWWSCLIDFMWPSVILCVRFSTEMRLFWNILIFKSVYPENDLKYRQVIWNLYNCYRPLHPFWDKLSQTGNDPCSYTSGLNLPLQFSLHWPFRGELMSQVKLQDRTLAKGLGLFTFSMSKY